MTDDLGKLLDSFHTWTRKAGYESGVHRPVWNPKYEQDAFAQAAKVRRAIEARDLALREELRIANETLAALAVKGDIWAPENKDVLFMKLQVQGMLVRTGKADVLWASLTRIAREFVPHFERLKEPV